MNKILKQKEKICKLYKNRNLTLKQRLLDPDDKSEKFIDHFFACIEGNPLQRLKHPIKTFKVLRSKICMLEHDLSCLIHNFTNIEEISDSRLDMFIETYIRRHPEIKEVSYTNRDKCVIKFKNGKEIPFWTLSRTMPDINKEITNLENSKRDHKCHPRSISITIMLPDKNAMCVTGKIFTITKDANWLHSWIETTIQDEKYCIDNNFNAILEKEDYYYIQHPTIIEKISKSRIESDIDAIMKLNKLSNKESPYIKLYCVNPDEAIDKYNQIISNEHSKPNPEI